MILGAGLFTLLLSLDGANFKEYTLLCSRNKYTFTKGEKHGVKNDNDEYYSQYPTIDDLITELDRQCARKKK